MYNPWIHDEVPDDGGVRRSSRWVTRAGILAWLTILAVTGIFVSTDVGGARATAVIIQVLQLTAVTTALCVAGWVVYRILRQLRLLNGALVNLFTLLFILALPLLIGMVAHQLGFLTGGLTTELSQAAPLEQWQEQASRTAIEPIKDTFPWS
jgi:hypothetical protein